MDIDFKFKQLTEEVKNEFRKEGLRTPKRILPIIANINSDPREMFLIRVRNILLEKLDSINLKLPLQNTNEKYIKTKTLYDRFTKESFEGKI